MDEKKERAIFIVSKPGICSKCGKDFDKGAWIELTEAKDAYCMACSDLGGLDYLPAGDACISRRAKKYSTRWAVVLKWARARNRYERQGLVVETEALEQADMECALDADKRKGKQKKAAVRREKEDQDYVKEFAAAVRSQYPGCPPKEEVKIARHACEKYSGRVGRSAMAKELTPKAIELAVGAHVRHVRTDYDKLLAKGVERFDALNQVRDRIMDVLDEWEGGARK